MDINSISKSGSASSQVDDKPIKNQLTPDDFIKLFLAQMKNQNPMKPTDSSAVLQQMSEIQSISTSKDMQKTLTALSDKVDVAMVNGQVLQSTQLIGKHVVIPTSSVPLVKDEGMSGALNVPPGATNIKVSIKDAAGNTIKTVECGSVATGGLVDFKWDGMGDNGKTYDPAFYSISAMANVKDQAISVPTAGAFKVNSVGLDKNGVVLNVDGLGGQSMSQIIKIL
jgi:flagellar basal-body rod modification protein FlgD